MPQQPDYKKTIKYPDEIDAKLQKLADQAGCTKRDFFIQMVEYFYRTKKDPKDINDELLKKTLAKNHDTYIRFIRIQEEQILIPLKVEQDRMVNSQLKIIDSFNTQVLKANRDILSGQQSQSDELKEIREQLKVYASKFDSKEQIKTKCLYILDQYIKERENMSFTTSSKDKESLIQLAKQQIAKI
jgi:hypothetical protein